MLPLGMRTLTLLLCAACTPDASSTTTEPDGFTLTEPGTVAPTGDTGASTTDTAGKTTGSTASTASTAATGDTGDTGEVDPQVARDAEVCGWFEKGGAPSVVAAGSSSEAGQAVVVPSDDHGWLVAEGAPERWLTAQVDEWMTELFVYASPGIAVAMPEIAPRSDEVTLSCGVTRRSYTVHEWGPYLLQVSGSGEAFLALRQVDVP